MISKNEKEIIKLVEKIIKKNGSIKDEYNNGKKGYVGFFMNKVIKKSTISFQTKKSKQELMETIKGVLNNS